MTCHGKYRLPLFNTKLYADAPVIHFFVFFIKTLISDLVFIKFLKEKKVLL